MNIKTGSMWDSYEESDFFCITTNSYIRKDGELVMGRGIALEAKTRFPELPKIFGDKIAHMAEYSVISAGSFAGTEILAFQVKTHYMDNAEHKLIERSALELCKLANTMNNKRFNLNFPGIGFGKLTEGEVLPIIEMLPDNVSVWKF